MQQVLKPEPQQQPTVFQALQNLRTVQGAFWTLAGTTLGLQSGPATLVHAGLSSWFGLVVGLFAVGLYDSLVPTGKEQVIQPEIKEPGVYPMNFHTKSS